MAGTEQTLTAEPEDYLVRYTWKVNSGPAFPRHTFEVAYSLTQITRSARLMYGHNRPGAALTLEAVEVRTRDSTEWTPLALTEPSKVLVLSGEAVAA